MAFDHAPPFAAFRDLVDHRQPDRFAPRSRPAPRYIANPFESVQQATAARAQLAVLLDSIHKTGNDEDRCAHAFRSICRLRAYELRSRAATRIARAISKHLHRPHGGMMFRSMADLNIITRPANPVVCPPRAPKVDGGSVFEYAEMFDISTLMMVGLVRSRKVSDSLLRTILKDTPPEVRECVQRGVMPPPTANSARQQ